MPHKRNPITSERICGLARILRGNLQAGLENIALWHERDMSHSSVERVILPDSFLLIHYMFVKVRGIIEGLVVHEERIAKNLSLTRGAIYSQILLVELIERGMARSTAHEAIKGAAQRALEADSTLVSALRDDPQVARCLKGEGIDEEALLDRVCATSRRLIERAAS